MRVLVVEDREDTQDSMEAYLRLCGCWTDHASNGVAALDRLAVSVPDAIVSDHKMPTMTGMEFIERLYADPRYDKIPVALLSGVSDDEIDAILEAVSGNTLVRFFHKPSDPAEIIRWLKQITGKLPMAPAPHAAPVGALRGHI